MSLLALILFLLSWWLWTERSFYKQAYDRELLKHKEPEVPFEEPYEIAKTYEDKLKEELPKSF